MYNNMYAKHDSFGANPARAYVAFVHRQTFPRFLPHFSISFA